jgi:hypothetical protein
MGDTLWLDKLVVVPYDQRNVTALPPLTAYLVEIDGITIDQFAADRFIEPNLLRRLNNLPRGYQLSLNEAIVIPYISP